MKNFYLLLFIFSIGTGANAQKAKPFTEPPSFSNIKIGMSYDDFIKLYPENTDKHTRKSTVTLMYDNLVINDVKVTDMRLTFFKSKLVAFNFNTNDGYLHLGLSAKYGYNTHLESESEMNGKRAILATYGEGGDKYMIIRCKYLDGGEWYIFQDKVGNDASSAEGF